MDKGTIPVRNDKKTYLTALGAWALAFGCSVGWGSFIMPGTTFLPIAGPVGTAAGIALGALVMMVIGANYHYLMNLYPDAGGTYSYTKNCFSYDHGLLNAWFLIITYLAIIWANASALPLVARTLLGSTFQFGFDYEIAGFHVYMGEILLAVGSLIIGALVCLNRKLSEGTQIVMAVFLFAGVLICFIAAAGRSSVAAPFEPAFSPDHSAFGGTMTVFALAPWAFVGFESITHSAAEARFSLKKSFMIMTIALITAGAAYALLSLLAVTALPEGCSSWTEYVADLGRYSGVSSQPTFHAAYKALGNTGSFVLGVAALCGIFTGLIGNYIALSRLMTAMAEDSMAPAWFGKLDANRVPRKGILSILAISAIFPFLGRTAISWIVDVTTVGATIAYAFASASAWKAAKERGDRKKMVTGVAGIVISLLFALEFLIPNITQIKTLSTESYLILATWGLLGFAVFRYLLKRGSESYLGRSSIAWIVLLGLIIFTSTVWMQQYADTAIDSAFGTQPYLDRMLNIGTIIQVSLIVAAFVLLFSIYSIIQKRERRTEIEKAVAEDASRAKTSFLSNMSHEIRTPMNAIIGLDNIALRNPDLQPETREQLLKIDASAKHLLGLINDILDMSRIESGRMVLKQEEFAFKDFLEQVNIMINSQCQDKGLDYECRIEGPVSDYYVGDGMKLKQVLINILGNSVKFTEAPGEVSLSVKELEREGDACRLRFTMKDSGIGMDEEFIPRLFEAFSQEDETATNRYGGSGLGMAITKSYVEMMKGDIHVESEKGRGSTFTVTVALGCSDRVYEAGTELSAETGLSGRRLLIAEDIDQNAEILLDLLDLEEIEADRAVNGKEAVEMFESSEAGYYDAVLMDVRMPVMDGLTATRSIRALERPDAATVPIIAMTANVYDEDVERSMQAGMNEHLSKPIEPEKLYEALARLIAEREG